MGCVPRETVCPITLSPSSVQQSATASGMSSWACAAVNNKTGTTKTSEHPRSLSRNNPCGMLGSESSRNEASTDTPGNRVRISAVKRTSCRVPSGLRVPWPTTKTPIRFVRNLSFQHEIELPAPVILSVWIPRLSRWSGEAWDAVLWFFKCSLVSGTVVWIGVFGQARQM